MSRGSKTKNGSMAVWVGLAVYLVAFFLPAVKADKDHILRGWECARMVAIWLVSMPSLMSPLGLTNLLALVYLGLFLTNRAPRLRSGLAVALLSSIAYTWYFIYYLYNDGVATLLGHQLWIAGMLLMLVPEIATWEISLGRAQPGLAILLVALASSGCSREQARKSGEAMEEVVASVQQGLAAKERAAIEAVGNKLSEGIDRLKAAGQADPRQSIDAFYDLMLTQDVAACPADFRQQYRRTVESVRLLKDALHDVPVGDDEAALYLLSQLGSSNPDFGGRQVLRDAQQKYQAFYGELNELQAVALKYGAK